MRPALCWVLRIWDTQEMQFWTKLGFTAVRLHQRVHQSNKSDPLMILRPCRETGSRKQGGQLFGSVLNS